MCWPAALHSILVKSILRYDLHVLLHLLLYIPFWLNLYICGSDIVENVATLHSILVKSIRTSLAVLFKRMKALHSILVKSILSYLKSFVGVCLPLHSILVKSILSKPYTYLPSKKLYIPFWLNLYPEKIFIQLFNSALHSILVKSILKLWIAMDYKLYTLHSILVKSIHYITRHRRKSKILYIPFWLNLYHIQIAHLFPQDNSLHSILVKSIPEQAMNYIEKQKTLHSILVKSIRATREIHMRF